MVEEHFESITFENVCFLILQKPRKNHSGKENNSKYWSDYKL